MKNYRTGLALIVGVLSIVIAMAFSAPPAKAGNTYFLTDKNGQLLFPLSPPNRATGGPGAIDNMTIGATKPAPGSFSTLTPAGATPTIASGACGTGTNGAVVAGSSYQSMQITIGAAATTSCAITWPTLSAAPKSCTYAEMNAAAAANSTLPYIGPPTINGVTLNGAVLASTNFSIQCF